MPEKFFAGKNFFKKFVAAIIAGAIIFFAPGKFSSSAEAVAPLFEDTELYWLFSDDNYSKYFVPDSVRVVKKAKTDSGREVATEIEAWTKTTYTPGGAAATIRDYGIDSIIPDPQKLSYSLALFRITPQNRTIQYAREDFYDANNNIIWSKADGRVKEINSQAFDEDFYVAIVDEVFRQGEVERKKASDRWIDLWSKTDSEGNTVSVSADTTTMQMKGTNLIVWEWQESKTGKGQITEIRFMKKAVNLLQGTEKIISGETWTLATKIWQELDDEYGNAYRMISNDEPAYKGLVRLRVYVKEHPDWVTRYSIK